MSVFAEALAPAEVRGLAGAVRLLDVGIVRGVMGFPRENRTVGRILALSPAVVWVRPERLLLVSPATIEGSDAPADPATVLR